MPTKDRGTHCSHCRVGRMQSRVQLFTTHTRNDPIQDRPVLRITVLQDSARHTNPPTLFELLHRHGHFGRRRLDGVHLIANNHSPFTLRVGFFVLFSSLCVARMQCDHIIDFHNNISMKKKLSQSRHVGRRTGVLPPRTTCV